MKVDLAGKAADSQKLFGPHLCTTVFKADREQDIVRRRGGALCVYISDGAKTRIDGQCSSCDRLLI